MAGVKKLPPVERLVQLAGEGLTNREIGDLYGATGEAVRQALDGAGIRRSAPRPSHARYIPWRVRADHVGHILARRLRALSNREQGRELRPAEVKLLEEWVAFMEGANSHGVALAVHYDRTDEQGFWLEPRREGDRDFIAPPS